MQGKIFNPDESSKLSPRGGPFQMMERINDNAYKLDLLDENNMIATFNVVDLNPFVANDEHDLRAWICLQIRSRIALP